ncbi:DEP domain-containing protein [Naegleria gruberi]|uniref:DEP domain-containing protein n=1 Tax=Naegleria gruberi TaxID=5762 RepID=D2V2L2_NAEGR|nr:DEP domain-containing protein [Naegleria gruberi]EFC48915.1 DEP domain-containing protein [Naegleria gruberi]|eukprot:XP_002681659.1 DEP domain-containing protein [Naegleria gruberi strain NEG-M]
MKLHNRRIKPAGSGLISAVDKNASTGNLLAPPQQQNSSRSASPSSNNVGAGNFNTPSSSYRKCLLMVHEKDFSDQEILINGKAITWLQIGDILEISQPKTPPSNEHNATTSSSPVSSSVNINSASTPIDISGVATQNYSDLSFSPFSSYKSPAKASTPPTGASFKQAPSVGNVTSNAQQQQPQPSFTSSASNPKTFIVKVTSLDAQKGVPYLSISKNIADVFDFQSRKDVYVRVIPKESAMLDYAVFSIRDHFLSRSDMWRFGLYLNDTSVYESKTLTWHGGIRVQVKELMKETTGKVSSGIIVYGHTKITYRSNSAVIYWLFQMSREMWEYDEYGNLIFERVINGFIKTVFDRWREVGVNHSLSIVFFSRHYITEEDKDNFEETRNEEDHMASLGNRTNINHSIIGSKDGKRYVDFYKVVDCTETQRIRSQEIRILLKKEFLEFENMVKGIAEKERVVLQNSSAADSNFMEAINLVLNSYDKYYINRDLTRTGQVILLVSPGSGMFDVQIPVLGKITTKRLMDVGLSVDLIAHSVPPLHSVPIFRYKKKEVGVSNNQESPHLKEYTYYRSPDWINITFYRENYFKNDICIDHEDCECTDSASNLFLPVSKMPNLETLPTNIPLFEKYWTNFNSINSNSHHTNNSSGSIAELCRQHDEQVFKIFQQSRQTSHYQTSSLSNISHISKKTSLSSHDLIHGTPTKQREERSIISDSSPKNPHIINHHLEELKQSEHISGLPSSGSSVGFESSFDTNHQNDFNGSTPSNNASTNTPQHGGSHSTHHLPITHNSASSMVNMGSANSGVLRRSPHSGTPFMAELAERHKAKELFYMKLFNPFHMDSETLSSPGSLQNNNQQNTFHRKRWGHLHPSSGLRPTQKSEYIKHFLLNVNWQGVSEPACLPITTDYWPESALKILNDFDLHTHTITDTNNIYKSISTLVRELIILLLHCDNTEKSDASNNMEADNISTISTGSNNSELSTQSKRGRGGRALRGGRGVNAAAMRRRPPTTNTSNSTSETTVTHESSSKQKVKPQKMEYCLSSANQFHKITYNPNISNMVTIDRYVPKVAKSADKPSSTTSSGTNSSSNNSSSTTLVNDADPFNNARSTYTYRYMLWNPTLKSYESRVTRFNSAVDYNWNKLDYLICGDHNQMTDELHNRSLQFHIVPINNSNKNLFASQTQLFGAFNNNSSLQVLGGSNNNSSSDLFSQASNSSNEYTKRLENFKKFKDAIVNRSFRGMDGDNVDVSLIGDESSTNQIPSNSSAKTAKLQFVPQEGGIDDNSRVEWLNIVYKASYHPAEFWSFKVQWLVCTAALIDEFLQTLARRARQLGFAMIQTPAEIDSYTNFVHASKQAADRLLHGNYKTGGLDPLENVHPFRSYVRIPITSIEAMYSIRNAICEPPLNFIPDSFHRKNSKRFIHISGCIILHIDAIKGSDTALITWIDNPFQTFDLNVANSVDQNDILNTLRKLVFSEASGAGKFTLQLTPGSNPFEYSQ